MANQQVVASVTVAQNLLLWSTWDSGIGAYDSVDFYTVVPQSLFVAMVTGNRGFAKPNATWLLGLLDQNGNELTGAGYGRAQVGFALGNWAKTGLMLVQNMVAILWPQASGAWQTASQLAIYDGIEGELLQRSLLQNPVTAGAGDVVQFGQNALTLQVPI